MEQSNHNSQFSTLNSQLEEFDEIRPYEPSEMKQAFEELINDRQFSLMLKGFVPWLPKSIRNGLLRLAFTGVKTPLDFQLRFMKPIVNYIIRRHTDGCTFDDSALVNSQSDKRYTFLSNHRDIVLDSAFLDVMLHKNGYPTTVEIGIGDNLLIYPWIKRLVRMNKAFTVRRGLTAHEMMRSSQLMSRYIHYAVTQKHENIWIAQREGRAKDSDDRTQDSVLKMLAMGASADGSPTSPADSLRELNIVPLTISYEYDPCDYLKAREFQLKRDNPAYKKSKQDDLDNMRTGILGYKGRVHYHCGQPVNAWLDELGDLPRNEFYPALSRRIDSELHRGYRLFPCNYIALDALEGTTAHADHYTQADRQHFEDYLQQQTAKVDIADKDESFLRERMLTMYANPLRNFLKTTLLPFLLLPLLLFSCTTDSYETGTGDSSLVEGDFAELVVDSRKMVASFVTDDGISYATATPVTTSWIEKADTTYRSAVYFEKRDGGKAEIRSLTYMPTLQPREPDYFKRQPQDPVGVESVWLAKSGKYINLGLLLKNGRVDDAEGVHALAVVCDEVRLNADQTRTAYYRLLHDQGDTPEYYSNRRYVSILVPDDRPDSVRLSIQTYEQGTIERRLSLNR